jgi:hypothetical protein
VFSVALVLSSSFYVVFFFIVYISLLFCVKRNELGCNSQGISLYKCPFIIIIILLSTSN